MSKYSNEREVQVQPSHIHQSCKEAMDSRPDDLDTYFLGSLSQQEDIHKQELSSHRKLK